MKKNISMCGNVRIFAIQKWPRSLMDRIKDSGSFGPGSNPGGVTFFYLKSSRQSPLLRISKSTPFCLMYCHSFSTPR